MINQAVNDTLTELEELKKNSDIGLWNIDRDTGQYLHDLVLKHKPKTILELGTSSGYSSIWLASAADQYGGQLYTLESHQARFDIATDSFKKSGLNNITQINGHAPLVLDTDVYKTGNKIFYQNHGDLDITEDQDTLKLSDINFDFVFLDCIKKYYLDIFKLLESSLKTGSIITADDMKSHPEPLQEFLKYVSKYDHKVIDVGTGLSVTRIS